MELDHIKAAFRRANPPAPLAALGHPAVQLTAWTPAKRVNLSARGSTDPDRQNNPPYEWVSSTIPGPAASPSKSWAAGGRARWPSSIAREAEPAATSITDPDALLSTAGNRYSVILAATDSRIAALDALPARHRLRWAMKRFRGLCC
jgi:hypothetical protein